ncbi:MAG TPA: hypothetical protein PK671_06715, partial [Candidatus Obscuribacter sp.]|nr:hypothetical protein [Candidatus Obscuribacter sp.]
MSTNSETTPVTPAAGADAPAIATPNADKPKGKTLDEQLKELQIAEARLRVEKARTDKTTAAQEAGLKLDLTRTQLRSAQLDLEKKEREAAREKASADENLTYTFYDGVTDESIKPS